MGERKVINKYIPADFDPSLIPRGKKLSSKDGTVPVRMMLPFSMQCETCHTFLYRGKKYNSKKEPVQGPEGRYLGIQRFRFYIKCNHCSRPITFTTDPKNADYEMESGATRNFELNRNQKVTQDDKHDNDKPPDSKEDAMKALENRVLDSQREMADLDNLEEIKAMNARHLRIDPLKALQLEEIGHDNTEVEEEEKDDRDKLLTEEDEALIRSIQFGPNKAQQHPIIVRLTEEDEARLDQERQARLQQQSAALAAAADQPQKNSCLPVPIKVKKRRRLAPNDDDKKHPSDDNDAIHEGKKKPKSDTATTNEAGLSSLLGGYGSSDESH